jgi:enamine deaminase RidA (YjgF/YER057c/UK114 family)
MRDFEAQCEQVFANVEAALKSAGAVWSDAAQFTTYSQTFPAI